MFYNTVRWPVIFPYVQYSIIIVRYVYRKSNICRFYFVKGNSFIFARKVSVAPALFKYSFATYLESTGRKHFRLHVE